ANDGICIILDTDSVKVPVVVIQVHIVTRDRQVEGFVTESPRTIRLCNHCRSYRGAIPCVASVFSGTDRLLFTIIMLVENHITAVVDKGNDIALIRAFLEQPAADRVVIDLIKAADIVLRRVLTKEDPLEGVVAW